MGESEEREEDTGPLPTAPPAAYQLRRHPETYPRHANGLPVPLYRVTRTEDDLHNFLAAMRPEDWGHCEMYVYQYYPRHRSIEGQPAYIDKICEGPVKLEEVIASHGSGVYGFTLNDANVQGNRRTVMYAKVELTRDDHPERYDLDRLWVDHKDNRTLVAKLVRDGILNKQGEQMQDTSGLAATVDKLTNTVIELSKDRARGAVPAPVAPDPNAGAMAQIHQKSLEMMGAANKAAIEAATASNKSGSVADTLQLVTAIAGLVQRQPVDNTPIQMLMEEIKTAREESRAQREAAEKERQRNHELQMAALAQKQTAADPFAQVEQVMRIRNLFGGGDTTPRNWKEQAIGMVSEHLPHILEIGGALVRSVGQPTPITATQLTPNGEQVAQALPAPAQPSPTQQAPNAQPPNPNVTPEQQVQIERITNLQGQLQQHGRFLVNALAKGQDGYTFAESMINMTDDLTYQKAAAFTLQEWMTAIFSFPQLQQQFAGVEHTVERFVAEFLDFQNPEQDAKPMSAEPPPEPPPVAPTKKGKQ